jgi:hypothetical protein
MFLQTAVSPQSVRQRAVRTLTVPLPRVIRAATSEVEPDELGGALRKENRKQNALLCLATVR